MERPTWPETASTSGAGSCQMTPHLKPEPLRQAIADSIAVNVKAYNVPAFCQDLGLPAAESDSAWSSKAVYVRGLLQGRDLADLVDVASRVLAVAWPSPSAEPVTNTRALPPALRPCCAFDMEDSFREFGGVCAQEGGHAPRLQAFQIALGKARQIERPLQPRFEIGIVTDVKENRFHLCLAFLSSRGR